MGNVPEPLSVSDRIRYRPAISAASYCGRGGSALRALGDGESGNTGRIVNVPAYTGSTPPSPMYPVTTFASSMLPVYQRVTLEPCGAKRASSTSLPWTDQRPRISVSASGGDAKTPRPESCR